VAPAVQAADLVELRFQSAETDTSLEDLLYFAVGMELSRVGFSSSRAGGAGKIILLTEYASSGADVHLVLTLSDSTRSAASAIDIFIPLDDSFEARVGQAIRTLLAKGTDSPGASGQAADIGGLFPEPPTGPETAIPTAFKAYTQATFGGTMVLGVLADVARVGLETSLSGGMMWDADLWSLQAGTTMETIRLFQNEGIVGGDLYLSSVAIEARWGTGRTLPFRLTAGGSIGVQILTVARERVLSKTIPLIGGDAGASLPVGYGFSLGGQLRFQIGFESILILGFTPTIAVGKEF